MRSGTLNLSGVFLILSGFMLAAAVLFRPDMSQPGYAASALWVWVNVVLGFSALFGLTGLGGLFSVMNLKIRSFGKAAFALAMLGNVLLVGILFFVEAAVMPVLARDPGLQFLTAPSGLFMTGAIGTAIGASLFIAAVGYLLLAGYLVMTRIISPANGILFIGAPLLLFSPPLIFPFGMIGGVLLGAGIAWLGISARSGVAHDSLSSTLQAQDECLAHMGHA
jgi:hypothetical protein